jgi:hypothetical protein
MYKYSKLVKEKFFKDNYLSFYWLIFRKRIPTSELLSDQTPDESDTITKAAKAPKSSK